MYEFIRGSVAELTPAYAVLEAGGVGYFINISLQTYSAIEHKDTALLYTHFIVRDDAQLLYGFATRQEREQFRLLLSVSGVGGNTARTILSTYSVPELSNIIMSENATLLKNVKGLGLKTAQKIIVELKDKMFAGAAVKEIGLGGGFVGGNAVYDEAMEALTMLGFARSASDKVLKEVLKGNPSASVEEAVRLSLKKM